MDNLSTDDAHVELSPVSHGSERTWPSRFSTPNKVRKEVVATTDPNAYMDTFKIGPFTFFVRKVPQLMVLDDDGFEKRAIRELGLLPRAERELKRAIQNNEIAEVDESEWDDVAYERALRLLSTRAFRQSLQGPELSARYNAMVEERYDRIIFGTGDDPDHWGGLVAWQGPVPSDQPDQLQAVIQLPVKLELYGRLTALSVDGVNDDLFRRSSGQRVR